MKMNIKCFLCLKKAKSSEKKKYICLNCFEISCQNCLETYKLLNTKYVPESEHEHLTSKFQLARPLQPKTTEKQSSKRGSVSKPSKSHSTKKDKAKRGANFYPTIVNQKLGKNSQFVCVNCCLNNLDPGVEIVQRITKLAIIRSADEMKRQMTSISLLSKFTEKNSMLRDNGEGR